MYAPVFSYYNKNGGFSGDPSARLNSVTNRQVFAAFNGFDPMKNIWVPAGVALHGSTSVTSNPEVSITPTGKFDFAIPTPVKAGEELYWHLPLPGESKGVPYSVNSSGGIVPTLVNLSGLKSAKEEDFIGSTWDKKWKELSSTESSGNPEEAFANVLACQKICSQATLNAFIKRFDVYGIHVSNEVHCFYLLSVGKESDASKVRNNQYFESDVAYSPEGKDGDDDEDNEEGAKNKKRGKKKEETST